MNGIILRVEQSRAGDVDLLRGICIVLMVMGHVSFGVEFDKWIHGFHMPVWFIISGFFANTKRGYIVYIKRKSRVIMVPYLFFSLLYEVIWSILGNNQWIGLIWPNTIEIPLNGALWFLPALFFVDIVGIFCLKFFSKYLAYITLFVLALVGSIHFIPLPLSLDSALVGCGFFLVGYILREHGKKLLNIKWIPSICLMILATIMIMLNGYVNVRTNEYAVIPLFWINAILATIALWNICGSIERLDTHIKPIKNSLIFLKKVGSDSLVYVCANQYFIWILSFLPISMGNTITMLIWHMIEVCIVVMACYLLNRIIRKTPLKIMLGK